MRTTLILFSGGIDSTHVLFDLLENTDDVVLAHHVHLINAEGRHLAEATACAQIVSYCKSKFRDFTYTDSLVDRHKMRTSGLDVFTAAYEGGLAAAQYLLSNDGQMPDRWTLGMNREELEYLSGSGRSRVPMLHSLMEAAVWPNTPPTYYRPVVKPKKQLIEEMGPELSRLCWTCRRPVLGKNEQWLECGECKTCLLMQEINADQETS